MSRNKLRNKQVPALTELVPVESLQDIQDRFSATTRVSSGLRAPPPDGHSITRPSMQTRFCKLIHSSGHGRNLCRECDLYNAQVALKKRDHLFTYQCHAGLVDTAAPICIEREHIGTIYAGPVLQHSPSAKQISHVLRIAGELGLEGARLLERMCELRIVSTDKMEAIAGSLQAVARHISQIGYEAYMTHEISQQQLKQIRLMDEVASSAVSADPLQGLEKLISVAVEVIGEEHSYGILGVDRGTQELVLMAGYGPRKIGGVSAREAARRKVIRIPKGAGLTWRAISRKEIIYASDTCARKWQRFHFEVDPETRSEIDVPLLLPDGQPVGCFNIESARPKAFDSLDMSFLRTLASHAAILITKVELFESLRTTSERLVDSESRAILAESAIGLAHTVRNPLQTITGQAELLLQDSTRNSKTRKWLNIILDEVDRINEVIKRQLEYAYETKLQRRRYIVNDILAQVLTQRSVRDWLHDGNITVRRTGSREAKLARVRVDKTLLVCALTNIIQNSVEAIKSVGKNRKGVITIDASLRKATGEIAIGIKDTGPGIKKSHFPNLRDVFKPYLSAKTTIPGAHFGLGLAIADKIIRQHDGQIIPDSCEGKGATFTIVLPTVR